MHSAPIQLSDFQHDIEGGGNGRATSLDTGHSISIGQAHEAPVGEATRSSHGMSIARIIGAGFMVLGVIDLGAGIGLRVVGNKYDKTNNDKRNPLMDQCKKEVAEFHARFPNVTRTCDPYYVSISPTYANPHNAGYNGTGIEYGGTPLAKIDGGVCKVDAETWCDRDLVSAGNPYHTPGSLAIAAGILIQPTVLAAHFHPAPEILGLGTIGTLAAECVFLDMLRTDPKDNSLTQYRYLATSKANHQSSGSWD